MKATFGPAIRRARTQTPAAWNVHRPILINDRPLGILGIFASLSNLRLHHLLTYSVEQTHSCSYRLTGRNYYVVNLPVHRQVPFLVHPYREDKTG